MTRNITQTQLRRNAETLLTARASSPTRVWHLFEKVSLLDEDGPAGSLLFSCHTDASMANPLGIVHGGITASLADTCMGIACAAQCGAAAAPAVAMTVNYARPVPVDADIRTRVYTVRVGATTGQMRAEVFLAEYPEEILVTAAGVYSVKRPRS